MESSFEQKSEEEAVPSTSKDFLSAEEKVSFEEAEELSEDYEVRVTSEELLESAQEDEEGQIESEESAEAIEDEEEAEIELPEATQEQDAVEDDSEESFDVMLESDEAPIQEESKETSELVQETQVKSEESSGLNRRKLRKQRKTPATSTSTSRASANRPSTSRISTRRAAKTNTSSNHPSTAATASISSSPKFSSSSSSSSSTSSSLTLSTLPSTSPPSSSPELPSNPIETTSAIAPMLPNQRLWKWVGKPNHTSGGNQYYTAIRRGRETISIGDSVLFYSYKPDEKPYIGKIVQLWSKKSEMKVKCDWFYRPEELHQPCTLNPPVIFLFF